MLNRTDEITRQARQGSMAALIQLLNEQLADAGVRTRAMFSAGILQLLCEAETVEQLEQSQLVQQVRSILEEISPRNFRRVNINARIAREQQLLWLEEISRDPDRQLLWSEEVTLTPPSFVQRLRQQIQEQKPTSKKAQQLQKSASRQKSSPRSYWQGIVGGIIFSALCLGGVWVFSNWRSLRPPSLRVSVVQTPSPAASLPSASPATEPDSFVEAVRLAESCAIAGQTAKTRAEWLELAAKWQRASELMQSVPEGDSRYATAQDRAVTYRQNSKMSQAQANKAP